ncbi:hypothetical protein MMC09_004927 [Bachmanniomyces sp. S44760]|nr:hypothetical protein [Bachmanniomyces sp. S44760]
MFSRWLVQYIICLVLISFFTTVFATPFHAPWHKSDPPQNDAFLAFKIPPEGELGAFKPFELEGVVADTRSQLTSASRALHAFDKMSSESGKKTLSNGKTIHYDFSIPVSHKPGLGGVQLISTANALIDYFKIDFHYQHLDMGKTKPYGYLYLSREDHTVFMGKVIPRVDSMRDIAYSPKALGYLAADLDVLDGKLADITKTWTVPAWDDATFETTKEEKPSTGADKNNEEVFTDPKKQDQVASEEFSVAGLSDGIIIPDLKFNGKPSDKSGIILNMHRGEPAKYLRRLSTRIAKEDTIDRAKDGPDSSFSHELAHMTSCHETNKAIATRRWTTTSFLPTALFRRFINLPPQNPCTVVDVDSHGLDTYDSEDIKRLPQPDQLKNAENLAMLIFLIKWNEITGKDGRTGRAQRISTSRDF